MSSINCFGLTVLLKQTGPTKSHKQLCWWFWVADHTHNIMTGPWAAQSDQGPHRTRSPVRPGAPLQLYCLSFCQRGIESHIIKDRWRCSVTCIEDSDPVFVSRWAVSLQVTVQSTGPTSWPSSVFWMLPSWPRWPSSSPTDRTPCCRRTPRTVRQAMGHLGGPVDLVLASMCR